VKPSGETRNGNTKNTKAARRARSCDLRADFVTFVFESLGQTDRRHPRRQARGAPIFFNGGAPAGAGETWYYKGMATNGFRSRRRAASSGQPKLALGASVLAEISTGEKAHALLLSLRFALLQVVARYSDRALFDPLNSADLLGDWGERTVTPFVTVTRYPALPRFDRRKSPRNPHPAIQAQRRGLLSGDRARREKAVRRRPLVP
jgi:hypothetical protein